MPADSSIYGNSQPVQPPNMLAQLAQVMQVQGAQNTNALAQYGLKKAERDDTETNALNSAYASSLGADGKVDRNKLYQALAQGNMGSRLPAIQKTFADSDNAQTTADQAKFKLATERHGYYVKTIGALANDPNLSKDLVLQAGQSLVQQGILPAEMYRQGIAAMPDDQAQLRAKLKQGVAAQMTPEQIFTVFAPKAEKVDNGGSIGFRDTNPNSPTFGQNTAGAPVAKVATPGDVLGHQDRVADRNQRASQFGQTMAKDYAVAGIDPNNTGGMDENSERTAKAIASGQLPAPTGMALLNPKNQRILGRVMEINPEYDATTVSAKKKAASDFTSGSQGNAMRSFAVAGQHLDQLGELVDALNNGNMQIVNKIGNAISQQTGSPAVTNFDAAKDVVSKEVIKAIVAGGGGVSEREELSKLMANAKSPAQLKGVITQYRNLMGAQHDALLQQRDAAGLPRSTLPNYKDANGSANAPTVPPDIAAILSTYNRPTTGGR